MSMTIAMKTLAGAAPARTVLKPFEQPDGCVAMTQVLDTFIPFIAIWALAYLAYPVSYPLTLMLTVPAGGLLVRMTVIQHDCMHGSFLPTSRANRVVGHLSSVFNLVPFLVWRRQHATHHGVANNLERRTYNPWTNCRTAAEYAAMPPLRRAAYRLKCLTSAPMGQIEGFADWRISGSS